MLREMHAQVMADAAHDCVKAIVTNSHSHRIMQRIGDAICKDRSPKLRLCCAEYLRQVRLFCLVYAVYLSFSCAGDRRLGCCGV